jgi:hypothetical protein
MSKDKELFDLDFSEIEARVIAAMSDAGFRKQHPPDWNGLESPTGRNPSELPPLHKLLSRG